MKRFIITGLAMSAPGSMGGNTKITLELARHFSKTMPVVMIIQKDHARTVTDNIEMNDNIILYPVEVYHRTSLLFHLHDAWHYTKELKKAFTAIGLQPGEPVFNCSDFLLESFSCYWLKPKFRFMWIPSAFLFIPNPLENLLRRYGFPFLLYILVFMYQRFSFHLLKRRGDLFVITNDCDKKYFSKTWHDRIFAFYGGVNIEQIQAVEHEPIELKYDMVFCSRLCAQKGIRQLLEIWKQVVAQIPTAKLAVIGNGAPLFEKRLKAQATRLNISHTIAWLGYVNHQAKYRIYRASRLFVHPTVYDNNGMVAAEALCIGLPVIMNDLDNLKTVYTTGCVKSDFSDYETTANTIVRLLTDPMTYNPVKPTAAEVNALRHHWDWTTRCSAFEHFLN